MNQVLGRACWNSDNARDILVTEALAGDDAIFLATHTPVKGFKVKGSHSADIETHTELGLLETLHNPKRRHVFCVIQGAPGAGKSHLIRWLDLHWDNEHDLKVLVQRANGSLAGALSQLREKLRDYDELFDGLGAPQTASLEGRASIFLNNLGAMLEPNHYATPLPDASWCERHDPSSLILNRFVRMHWTGPGRILRLVDGGAGRNSQSARFHLDDIALLADQSHEADDSAASQKLARKLVEEARAIRDLIEDGCEPEALIAEIGDQAPQSVALMNALNARLNDAIRQVLGVSQDGLKRLFEGVRAQLARDNRRLVLLLEDITSVQGIDDTLIDVLVRDEDTVQDVKLCPLISVVGVTPEYYREIKDNYIQRITHDIDLGESSDAAGALRSVQTRGEFVSRYLSAVRAGPAALVNWRKRAKREPTLPAPNPCLDCNINTSCHKAFGEIEGVGLFPFTPEALETFYACLRDDGQHRHKTPRGMLQAVLNTSLLSAERVDAGIYPGPQIETEALERRPLGAALRNRIEVGAEDERKREQLRRLLSYWGDLRAQATRDRRGNKCYGGVPKAVSDAFGLPWLGGDLRVVEAPPASHEQPEASPEPTPIVEPTETISRDAKPRAQPASPNTSRPTRRRPLQRSELQQLHHDVEAFRKGEEIKDVSKWNTRLFEAVNALNPRKLGVDRYTFGKFFTEANVKLEKQSSGVERHTYFVVERELWLLDGLEAIANLRFSSELEDADLLLHRQNASIMLRRLEPLARAHIERRLKTDDPSTPWSPVAAAVQVLLARAWLQATTTADAPAAAQWSAILSDESGAESDPQSRIKQWGQLLDNTKNTHAKIREALREMVDLPQGESGASGLTDPSIAADALSDLRRILKFAPPLSEDEPSFGVSAPLQFIRLCQVELRERLPRIPIPERQRLTNRVTDLEAKLHGASIATRLTDLEGALDRTSAAFPQLAATRVSDCKRNLVRMRAALDADTTASIENMIHALHEPDVEGQRSPSQEVSALAAAPAKSLAALHDILNEGDGVMTTIIEHLSNLVRSTEHAPNLDAIRTRGRAFTAAADEAREKLKEAAP